MITDKDPVHYKKLYRERNKANGNCIYGVSHSKPEPGSVACEACNKANRERMQHSQGHKSWIETGKGRPPNYLVKKVDPAAKIAKLKTRLEKHIFWVDHISGQIAKLEGKTKKPILARFTEFMKQNP